MKFENPFLGPTGGNDAKPEDSERAPSDADKRQLESGEIELKSWSPGNVPISAGHPVIPEIKIIQRKETREQEKPTE